MLVFVLFWCSFQDALKESDEEDEEFLKVRVKSEDEKKEEENAYIEWFKGEKERIDVAETRDMVLNCVSIIIVLQ